MPTGGIPEADDDKRRVDLIQGVWLIQCIHHFEIGGGLSDEVCHQAVSPVVEICSVFVRKEFSLSCVDIFFKKMDEYGVLSHVFGGYILLYKIDEEVLEQRLADSGLQEHHVSLSLDGVGLGGDEV